MADGYVYCFANPSMPGILKVGATERPPGDRLREANAADTWRPPTPYQIEFAKRVADPIRKERALHALLAEYTERVHPRREFFRVTPSVVRRFFDLMDGEMWAACADAGAADAGAAAGAAAGDAAGAAAGDAAGAAAGDDSSSESGAASTARRRDMAQCFTHGQRIRHAISTTRTWIGIYDSTSGRIVYDGLKLTLNAFAMAHYRAERSDRISVNAWRECECEVAGVWISTYELG